MDLQDYVPPLPGIKGKSIRHMKEKLERVWNVSGNQKNRRRGEGEVGGGIKDDSGEEEARVSTRGAR